jgi:hypothetical protein
VKGLRYTTAKIAVYSSSLRVFFQRNVFALVKSVIRDVPGTERLVFPEDIQGILKRHPDAFVSGLFEQLALAALFVSAEVSSCSASHAFHL